MGRARGLKAKRPIASPPPMATGLSPPNLLANRSRLRITTPFSRENVTHSDKLKNGPIVTAGRTRVPGGHLSSSLLNPHQNVTGGEALETFSNRKLSGKS